MSQFWKDTMDIANYIICALTFLIWAFQLTRSFIYYRRLAKRQDEDNEQPKNKNERCTIYLLHLVHMAANVLYLLWESTNTNTTLVPITFTMLYFLNMG